MQRQKVLELFDGINVYRRNGKQAPHKPLLLLLALERVSTGGPRMMEFAELAPKLTRMIRSASPFSASNHPEYPFWRLQADRLWETDAPADIKRRRSNSDILKSELIANKVSGGFTSAVYDSLVNDPSLVNELRERLLAQYFKGDTATLVRSFLEG